MTDNGYLSEGSTIRDRCMESTYKHQLKRLEETAWTHTGTLNAHSMHIVQGSDSKIHGLSWRNINYGSGLDQHIQHAQHTQQCLIVSAT